MIAFRAGARVWIAGGVTDMRCGMNSLALKVQQGLGRDPHGGEIFCFRGRKDERYRSSGLAGRCSCPAAGHAPVAAAGIASLELEGPAHGLGRLTMQLNKVYAVKTVDRVAAELGETVDRLHDLAISMEPEDGIIWVRGGPGF